MLDGLTGLYNMLNPDPVVVQKESKASKVGFFKTAPVISHPSESPVKTAGLTD